MRKIVTKFKQISDKWDDHTSPILIEDCVAYNKPYLEEMYEKEISFNVYDISGKKLEMFNELQQEFTGLALLSYLEDSSEFHLSALPLKLREKFPEPDDFSPERYIKFVNGEYVAYARTELP